MVATVAEARAFSAQVRSRGAEGGRDGGGCPSAALLAHRMLEAVDFLSIGTNDLTQYAMAADRMATDLAHLHRPLAARGPAALIAITAHAGSRPASRSASAARPPPTRCWPARWSAWASRRCRWPRPPYVPWALGWPRSPWTSARRPPRPPSSAADPMAGRGCGAGGAGARLRRGGCGGERTSYELGAGGRRVGETSRLGVSRLPSTPQDCWEFSTAGGRPDPHRPDRAAPSVPWRRHRTRIRRQKRAQRVWSVWRSVRASRRG